MAVKTYVPTFQNFWLHFSYKYATRWQAKLQANLSSGKYACLVTWIGATATLIACLGEPD